MIGFDASTHLFFEVEDSVDRRNAGTTPSLILMLYQTHKDRASVTASSEEIGHRTGGLTDQSLSGRDGLLRLGQPLLNRIVLGESRRRSGAGSVR